MKIPIQTKHPRFYVATGPDEAFSSWNTIKEARACIERLKNNVPEDYKRIIGIYETIPTGTDIRDRIFHAKGIKSIDRIPGGMKDGCNVYVIVHHDQGFHFYLVSERPWVESQNTLKSICDVINSMFPAQEDDIFDEPEVTEHVRLFSYLHHLLAFVESHHMKIVSSNKQV